MQSTSLGRKIRPQRNGLMPRLTSITMKMLSVRETFGWRACQYQMRFSPIGMRFTCHTPTSAPNSHVMFIDGNAAPQAFRKPVSGVFCGISGFAGADVARVDGIERAGAPQRSAVDRCCELRGAIPVQAKLRSSAERRDECYDCSSEKKPVATPSSP